MRWVDVTSDREAEAAVLHPDWVARFEAMGFCILGRVRAIADTPVEELAKSYVGPDRDWFLAHAAHPATVLISPDTTTVVDVSSLFGSPAVRLRTRTTSGGLIETVRRWDRLPALHPGMHGPPEPIEVQQGRGHMPERGRSVAIVAAEAPGPLWEAHLAHLAAVGGDPVPADLSTYLATADAARRHEVAIQHQQHVTTLTVVMAGLIALLGVIGAVWFTWGVGWGIGAAVLCSMSVGPMARGAARVAQWIPAGIRPGFSSPERTPRP